MIETLRSYWHTALGDIRFQGVEVLLWRIFVKLLSPLVRLDLQILFDIDLSRGVRVLPARVSCVIEPATEADVEEIVDMQMRVPAADVALDDAADLRRAQMLRARGDAIATYLRQLRAGEGCWVARIDGRIVHSNWLRFHGNAPTANALVALQPGEVYSTDGYTREAFRGLRLHEAVATHMQEVARQRGCHRAYTITDLVKAGSRRGVRRIGWRWRGTILYLSPRGLGRTWLLRLGGDVQPLFEHARAAARGG